MPNLPTHAELVEEYRLEVVGDPDTNLTDFSLGSVNRGFAGIAATAARGCYRWMMRLARTVFVAAAEGSDLDDAIADRIGDALPRLPGESDDDYRARYYAYVNAALRAGTQGAWSFFLSSVVEGVDALESAAGEDLETGAVTLTISAADGYTVSEVEANVAAALPAWRILGIPANVEVT